MAKKKSQKNSVKSAVRKTKNILADSTVFHHQQRNISPVLSIAIKKILDRGNKNKSETIAVPEAREIRQIRLDGNKEKEFKISIAHDPLDQYSSPFSLDLSQLDKIEKVSSIVGTPADGCLLPGEEMLGRFHLLEFWSLNDSEILNWLSSVLGRLTDPFNKSFKTADFSVKLPLVKPRDPYAEFVSLVSELTLVDLMLRCIDSYCRLFDKFDRSLQPLRDYFSFENLARGQDEIVNLNAAIAKPKSRSAAVQAASKRELRPLHSAGIFSGISAAFKRLGLRANFGKLTAWVGNFPCWRSFSFSHQDWVRQLKPALIFFLAALLIIAPVKLAGYWQQLNKAKGTILGEAEAALSAINAAGNELKSLNFDSAGDYLSQANDQFVSAQKQLDEVKSFLTFLAEAMPANNSFKSGKNLLELGEHLTLAGEHLLKGTQDATEGADLTLSSRLNNFKIESSLALKELEQSQDNLRAISADDLPEDRRGQYLQFSDNLPLLISSLKKSQEIMDFTISLIGNNELKRYLLIFQNDNELRATGGFMGSYALLDIKNGKIEKISLPAGGTYDLKAGLKERLEPPAAMRLVSSRWEFQDANWWPDWPKSAAYINWFYNKSGGPTIDGIIAINSNWLGALIDVLGPIEMKEFNKTITAQNFEMELQKSIEIESTGDKPKAILSALSPLLLDKILNAPSDKFLDLAKIINSGLNDKEISIYLVDDGLNGFVAENNWDGRQKLTDPDTDYLQVVSTNIGGGKTDNAIRQKIYHQAQIQPDGSIIDTLIINRYDFGPIDEYFSGQINNSYLRVYVPLGSKLVKAAGFSEIGEDKYKPLQSDLALPEELREEKNARIDEQSQTRIYDENGKTVFANWSRIGPQSTKEIMLVYQLPFKIQPPENQDSVLSGLISSLLPQYAPYKLLIQKQSGRDHDEIVSQIDFPAAWPLEFAYPDTIRLQDSRLISQSDTLKDNFYLAAFKPR